MLAIAQKLTQFFIVVVHHNWLANHKVCHKSDLQALPAERHPLYVNMHLVCMLYGRFRCVDKFDNLIAPFALENLHLSASHDLEIIGLVCIFQSETVASEHRSVV